MEELEQALKKYNMGDEQTIKEIIAEVDSDRVSYFLLSCPFLINYSALNLHKILSTHGHLLIHNSQTAQIFGYRSVIHVYYVT